jgi:glutamate-1-semialdehyde 2,1-aminomutase
MGKSQQLYKKAKYLIPGGTQLLSKRPEMFLPELWPAYYSKADGCEVWDLDGNKYIDMSYMGIGSCILGYADKDVNRAVSKAICKGSMCTLNAPEEVYLAETLVSLHPWSQMVRYARTGGEAMAIAVRIARAASKRDIVLFCGYHGWHDWYLGANLSSKRALDGHLLPGLNSLGVPRNLRGSSFPFRYNDSEGFLKLINKYKNKIGAVVLEPIRDRYPEKEFFKTVQQITRKLNIVLIVDEITAGFRLNLGGAHLLFNLEPDIAVFSKGISNGFPFSAVIGKKKIMEIAQDTFISSTYWTDRIGPTAAIATIKKLKKYNVSKHLKRAGRIIMTGWEAAARKYKIKINVSGIDPLVHFSFDYSNELVLKTLYTQLMLDKGFLASTAFYASYSHKDIHIKKYLNALDDAFCFISMAIQSGKPEQFLKGPICHKGFKRLT